MNRPLPKVTCQHCNMVQSYTGQKRCTSCGRRLNDWSVASQLAVSGRDFGDEDDAPPRR